MKRYLFLVAFIGSVLCATSLPVRGEDKPKPSADSTNVVRVPDEARQPFIALLGSPLPPSLQVDRAQSRVERAENGSLKRLYITAKLARDDFRQRFKPATWKEVLLSKEDREPMHLSPDTPKEYMTCYVGAIDGKQTKLFWSNYAETLLLSITY